MGRWEWALDCGTAHARLAGTYSRHLERDIGPNGRSAAARHHLDARWGGQSSAAQLPARGVTRRATAASSRAAAAARAVTAAPGSWSIRADWLLPS
jgi:hypothetical protein